MAHPQLSIVIPAYNESARIENALERVMSCVQEQGWDAEVLVVDDGSKDDTAAIVKEWMSRYPRLHLVQNPGNRGKGYSVRNGLLQAAGDCGRCGCGNRFALDGQDTTDDPSAALQAVLRTLFQLGDTLRDGAAVQRYTVRVQSL